MNVFHKITHSNFFIKLTHWEYWPFGIIQAPVIFYYLWCVLRERSFFFFSASNPGILAGGMLGESKFEVLELVPKDVKPVTALIKLTATAEHVMKVMKENNLGFPVIFKPDLGERGWMVKRIQNEAEVEAYLKEIKIDFLVQELVDLPHEFGVFYVRYPGEVNGTVNSITMKEFLFVEGDGVKTLRELILEKDRAKLQWPVLERKFAGQLKDIPEKGKKIELVSVGNHCLGTKFLNGNHLITEKLISSFDRISKQINGFNFGRFDLRCASLADLENGKIKVMELNGCGAEPAHIYHPGSSLWKAIGVLLTHWKNIYRISAENHARGVPYLSFKEGRAIFRKFKVVNQV